MDRDKAGKRNGKVRRTNDIEEERRFRCSPDYKLELYSGREIGETGRLDIGEFKPRKADDPSLPRFGIRWDERKSEIDVDPFDCTEEESSLFRADAPGYSGHHTTILDEPGRVAEWKLVWKGECLYHGRIKCPVGRDVEFSDTLGIRDSMRMTLRHESSVTEFIIESGNYPTRHEH